MLSKLASMWGRRRNSFDISTIDLFVDLMAVSNSKSKIHKTSPSTTVFVA